MKKFLFILACCLCLCGCGKTNKTICINEATLNDGRTNYYTWILKHDNSKIIEKEWKHSYEYETLAEAINEEQRYTSECKTKNYYCNITRNDKTVTYHISYKCGDNSLDDNNCNYLIEIESLENNKFTCKEY